MLKLQTARCQVCLQALLAINQGQFSEILSLSLCSPPAEYLYLRY
nr:MAG TPA: hypothetical protein [Caudoviricetes sp.]